MKTKTPFTWEAFWEASEKAPELDMLNDFSYEHLHGQELDDLVVHACGAALRMKVELARGYRLLEHLTRLQLRERTPKAPLVPFPGGETLQ